MAMLAGIANAVTKVVGIPSLIDITARAGLRYFAKKKSRKRARQETGTMPPMGSGGYGFSNFDNTEEPHLPVGVVYGQTKVLGQRFYKSVKTVDADSNVVLDMMVGLSEGPVDTNANLTDSLRVNGIKWSDLIGLVDYDFYTGTNTPLLDSRGAGCSTTYEDGTILQDVKRVRIPLKESGGALFFRTLRNNGTTSGEDIIRAGIPSSGDERRCLLQFDRSALPSSYTVKSLRLFIKVKNEYNTGGNSFVSNIRMLRRTPALAADWNTYDGTNSWTLAGAKNDSSDITASNVVSDGGSIPDGTIGGWWVMTLDHGAVENWFNSNPGQDGFLLLYTQQTDSDIEFDEEQPPYLEYVYTMSEFEYTFKTAGKDVSSLDLILALPQGMYQINSDGTSSFKCYYEIAYRPSPFTGAWTTVADTKLELFQRGIFRWVERVFSDLSPNQYEIRVKKKITDYTADPNHLINDLMVEFRREIRDYDFRFPNTAYLGLTLEATDQIGGAIPSVSLLLKGRTVRVYTNSDSYTETWSDNPAWCLLDLITHPRYGLGISHDKVNLDSFLESAAWFDAKNYAMNVFLGDQSAAPDLLSSLLLGCRGFLTWSDCVKLRTLDTVVSPVQNFNADNILVDEQGRSTFSVSRRPRHRRSNRLTVRYQDAAADYEERILSLDDLDSLSAGDDLNENVIELLGVTSQTQAESIATCLLKEEMYSDIFCRFRTGIASLECEVGDVISVTHDLTGWEDKWFRIIRIEEDQDDTLRIEARLYDAGIYS